MSVNFNVRSDISAALSKLASYPRDQVPFAVAKALTATAQQTATLLTNKLPEYFDRPTPFTMRAIGFERASKTAQRARIFIKRDQLAYLQFGIDGGTRFPKKRAIPLPVDQAVNQFGNLPRNTLARLLARKDVFSGRVNGIGGIWQRDGTGKLHLLIAWASKAAYRKRFPYYEIGGRTVREAFPRNLRLALIEAKRTAR